MLKCRRDCLHRAFVESYQAARDARNYLRESGTLVPTSVPGAAGSGAAMHQLEDADFDEYVPAPRFKDWLIEQAAERRYYQGLNELAEANLQLVAPDADDTDDDLEAIA
jgi:hypothetical protein